MASMKGDMLDLVGLLHDGLADETIWDRALDAVSKIIGSPHFFMGTVNQGGRPFELIGHRMTPGVTDLLAGKLANRVDNPWVPAAVYSPLRRPVTVDNIGGQQLLEQTRVWQDIYLAYGLADAVGMVLERQPECADVLVIARPQGQPPFERASLDALTLLAPHLARAWRVKRALVEWEERVGTLTFALDRLARAVIVTDGDGKVRFANRAADRLLSAGDGVDTKGGRIRARDPHGTAGLHSLIRRATTAAIGEADLAVDAMALRRIDDGVPLAVVVEPIAPTHAGRLGHDANPGALLFIGDSEASSRPSARRLRIVYGLTRAEARLTELVVQGHGLAAAADVMGITANTAKFHMKTVFQKVGVSRQTELIVRVMADVGGLAEPDALRPA
jgi:DNA-binding CsgD family transcriptional regulator/PAS domain-containing protein